MLARRLILPALLATVSGCVSTRPEPIPAAWMTVPEAVRYSATMTTPRHAGPVRIERGAEGERLANGDKPLTPWFRAIESFDLSDERKEVIFSAKRKDNFDIGLVSADGSDVHWVPEDPADETDVAWAPRGNKVSFVVHGRIGDYVRTVHIPTTTALTVDFPRARVHAVRWDMRAEHFDAVVESADASERVETMTYAGEGRRITTPPAVRLDVDSEPAGSMLLLRPKQLHYGEKLPLVVWIGDPTRWNDARAALMQHARVAVAIGFTADWKALQDVAWSDPARVFVVGADGGGNRLSFVPDAAVPAGHYSRKANVFRAAPAVVESFAAGFLADQLNGRNR